MSMPEFLLDVPCIHILLVIEVDLKAAHFKPGKANYERVKQCLNERLNQQVDFIISWTNQGWLNIITRRYRGTSLLWTPLS